MSWFKNLRTTAKVLLGFGTMICVLAIGLGVAYNAIVRIRDSGQGIERQLGSVVDLVELKADQNRIRALILELGATADPAEMGRIVQDIESRERGVEERAQAAERLVREDLPGSLARLEELRSLMAAYQRDQASQVKLILEGKAEQAKAMSAGVQGERYEKIRLLEVRLGDEMRELVRAQVAASGALARRSICLFVVVGVLALLLGLTMTQVLNRLIAVPLRELTAVAERIAVGDLSVNVLAEARSDEVGVLARTFDRMTRSLREQMRQLAEGANVLGAAASEIVAASTQLAASASESAVAVSETATTVQEVRQATELASQKARAVSDSAQKVAQFAQSGRRSTEDAGASMSRIRQQMEAIAASMVRLGERSQSIGEIVAAVDDLAAQSNLLAVNAAIEAARAGEQGKGFSVVAQEVKRLAEQSRQATNQVRTILSDIQKATTTAVLATEQGSKAVEAGETQSAAAGEAIQALAGSVTEAAQAATQIAASGQQQLVGMDQVAMAMESINQASSQNVISARQLEVSACDLNDLGKRLKEMVETYKV